MGELIIEKLWTDWGGAVTESGGATVVDGNPTDGGAIVLEWESTEPAGIEVDVTPDPDADEGSI